MKVDGAQVVVVGMARSGIAAVELLIKHGARVCAADQNPAPVTLCGQHFPVEPQSEAVFGKADLVILSPGVPANLPIIEQVRRRGIQIVGDLELASWYLKGKIIGITGSNGKTTTTALTGHIMKSAGIAAQVGGNIGLAPASMVDTSRDGQWNVLELSSFQLETTDTFHPHVAAVLNVTPDHLDRHGTMERYAAAKGRIFVNQTPRDFAVLNADDTACTVFAHQLRARTHWFSGTKRCDAGAFLADGSIVLNGEVLMKGGEVPLRGLHNLENTMAAAVMAQLAGATHEQIRAAVTSFPGVEHRLEFVRDLNGVAWYNDSKATNVDATLKAIAAFPGGLWVILGGKDKDSDYSMLAAPLKSKCSGVFLIGAAADKIAAQLNSAAPLIHAKTLDNAVARAAAASKPGDTVLLAPACASFDQFENFEHRGREFKRLVREL